MVTLTYNALPQIVSIRFQILFHSPPGVLFTFPSRYSFTIGHQVVFSLTRWSGLIPMEFHVLHGTWDANYPALLTFNLQVYHPLWPSFPTDSVTLTARPKVIRLWILDPSSLVLQRLISYIAQVFGCSRFAHHYSGNHFVFFS